MKETKKKRDGCSGLNDEEEPKKKERHIVSWTPQEDDILRQQISLHGTENWAIIASKFKDKSTRQCRRRWYTYLNSDFKKGGWSPEEDTLLCEAQRIFGNRWTEIAKVVPGRTDNAVKNRFTTLCKKRAQYEALSKQRGNKFIFSNDRRPIFRDSDRIPEDAIPAKKMGRSHLADGRENFNFGDRSHPRDGSLLGRSPFTVLSENFQHISDENAKELSVKGKDIKTQGSFLKKNDPKIAVLMQQAELLSSLALKVNTEKTDQSLENAWKILRDFLDQSKENAVPVRQTSDADFQLEDFKDLIMELRNSNDGNQLFWRQPEGSPSGSEYSTGSNIMPYVAHDGTEQARAENHPQPEDHGTEIQSNHAEVHNVVVDNGKEMISSVNETQEGILQSSVEQINGDMLLPAMKSAEFGSPLQVNPVFQALAAGIPSPKFSESERSFLLKTLGIESPNPSPGSNMNPSQPPSCKRALLQTP